MSTMSSTESVIDVDIRQTRELEGKVRVVLLLLLVETDVLQESHLSILKSSHTALHLLAHIVLDVHYGYTQVLRETRSDRCHLE